MNLQLRPYSSYKNCLSIEEESFEILRPFIYKCSINGQYVVVRNSLTARELQLDYGDVFLNAKGGRLLSIELKAELDYTGNLFIETYSNKSIGRLGWFYKKNTDYLIYHFINKCVFYSIKFREFQRWLKPIIDIYPEVPQRKYDQRNDTWGRLVPIKDIKDGIKHIKEFDAVTFNQRCWDDKNS